MSKLTDPTAAHDDGGRDSLTAPEWLTPAAIGFACALALIALSYFRSQASPGLRAECAALKILGVAALLACLLEPVWSGQRAKPGANLIAIVADNSQSMALHDRGVSESRGESLQKLLGGADNKWRPQLAQQFDLRNYFVDSRLRPTQDFHELTFDGHSSALGASLSLLAERYRGQPLAGVVLLTDGVADDLSDLTKLQGLPPIYPVVIGGDGPTRDLAVGGITVTQTAFEDAPVTVQAEVSATGFDGEEIVGKLVAIETLKPGQTPAASVEQTVSIARDTGRAVLRFQLRPAKAGVLFYRLTLAPKAAGEAEATLANNETVVTVDRGTGPHRILYVSGRPNWEYKFLNRAVQEDIETRLVGLIRIAKREPKFEFRGRAGESSNPLFRGFGNQSKEDVERYDQPVFVRLNTEDAHDLIGGFPKTAEELFKYKALIFDDLEAEFFTADQQSLVQRFVSERGGGLLALGGAESFREGKFARTAIGDLLPVYLDAKADTPPTGTLKLTLTREGWLQPWARLRSSEGDERHRLDELPQFDVLNRVGDAKPAATVIASVTDGTNNYPALVTQRFGRGRTASLLIGDFWQGGLGDDARQKDLGKAWRQMVRWLVADVPDPIEVSVEPFADAVRVQVRVRDAKFQPVDNATISLKISRAGSEAAPISLSVEPGANEPGLYEATYTPGEAGGYNIEVAVTNDAGAAIGSAQGGWTTDLAAAEFRELKPNRALMEQLAKQTGGEVLTPDKLDAFARDLPSKHAPIVETWTRPLWHTPWMFLFALACFVIEWGLRRKNGLA